MKIVVLDGYTLNPGDLSWGSLHALGEVSIYEWTPKNEIANRCKSADIVLTNKTILDATIINNLDTVKYIGVLATGYNVVDVKSASKRGIVVTNVPNYGPSSVAQHTFALILELVNQVGVHNQSVKEGEWAKTEDFCYNLTPLVSLEGKVIGIVGYGYIGKRVARIAQGFGMEVLIHSKSAKSTDIGQLVSIERLNRESDIISLHCALTEDNENMINKSFLSKMKSRSYLINTSRGPLINE
ncbi:MAG: NAD(P)-dependent oxidoreductase, partial [Bacteroidota bacterium]